MPNDLLELNLGQVQAVVAGYGDRMVDMQCLALYSGYYSGYYSNSRRPSSPSTLIDRIIRAHDRSKRRSGRHSTKPVVDMDAEVARFKELEKRRLGGR